MHKQKFAVFGSAFNPPYRCHEDVIAQALAVFDRVLVVPNYKRAFGKVMMPCELRLAMAQLLVVASPVLSFPRRRESKGKTLWDNSTYHRV